LSPDATALIVLWPTPNEAARTAVEIPQVGPEQVEALKLYVAILERNTRLADAGPKATQ